MRVLVELADRFRALVGATRREASEVRVAPEPPPPDPEATIREALGGWVTDGRCQKDFVKWLSEQMDKAIVGAQANHLNLTESNYALGFEAGLRFVRDRLQHWAK
jgi:hypothetical protein